MRFTAIDMFCGAGGASKGAELAGAHILQGIDSWSLAAKTFGDNFRDAKVATRNLGPYSRPSRAFRRGEIDLLLASPECTNHSVAKGAKPRCEKSQRTSNYVLNFARTLLPRWIVLENVIELRLWHGFDALIHGLRNLGTICAQRFSMLRSLGYHKLDVAFTCFAIVMVSRPLSATTMVADRLPPMLCNSGGHGSPSPSTIRAVPRQL
jgi:site-specific DNA-cytosine methylase